MADENSSSGDPTTQGMKLAANIAEATRAIRITNKASDEIQLAKNEKRHIERQLQPADRVQVYRPQNRDNVERLLAWGTSGTVVHSNELTAKVVFDHSNKHDYVSRAHLRFVLPRPPHLQVAETKPVSDTERPGGGLAPLEPPLVNSAQTTTTSNDTARRSYGRRGRLFAFRRSEPEDRTLPIESTF